MSFVLCYTLRLLMDMSTFCQFPLTSLGHYSFLSLYNRNGNKLSLQFIVYSFVFSLQFPVNTDNSLNSYCYLSCVYQWVLGPYNGHTNNSIEFLFKFFLSSYCEFYDMSSSDSLLHPKPYQWWPLFWWFQMDLDFNANGCQKE